MKQKSGMFLWKFIGFFLLSYMILSIPYNKKPLFNHAFELTSPATTPMYSAIKRGTIQGFHSTERFAKKLFTNSAPTQTTYNDSVRNNSSAPLRNSHGEVDEINNDITDEEKASLEKALQEE